MDQASGASSTPHDAVAEAATGEGAFSVVDQASRAASTPQDAGAEAATGEGLFQ